MFKFLRVFGSILLCILFAFTCYFSLVDKVVKADDFGFNSNYSQSDYNNLNNFYNSGLVSDMSANIIVKGLKQTYSMPYIDDNNLVGIDTVELRFTNNNQSYMNSAYNAINNKRVYNVNIMRYYKSRDSDWSVGIYTIKGDIIFLANKVVSSSGTYSLRVTLCLDLYSIVEYRPENNCSYYDVNNEHVGFLVNNSVFAFNSDFLLSEFDFPCISAYFSKSYLNSVCNNVSAYYYDAGFDFISLNLNHNIFNKYLFNFGYLNVFVANNLSFNSCTTSFFNNGSFNYNYIKSSTLDSNNNCFVTYYWQSNTSIAYDYIQLNFVGGWHDYNGYLPEYRISFSNKLGSGAFLQNDLSSENDYSNDLYKKDVQWYDIFGHLYNFLIYLLFDMPLISNITKPVYMLISGSITTFNWLAGLIAGLGIFGAFAMVYLLFAVIKRFL